MEKGTVRSYDRESGSGTIGCGENADVRFSADRILGKDRNGLKQGDLVWFEIENIQNNHSAINIRKCI